MSGALPYSQIRDFIYRLAAVPLNTPPGFIDTLRGFIGRRPDLPDQQL
jgi:hypothetical protein